MLQKNTVNNSVWNNQTAICLLLVLVTFAVFYRVSGYDFVNFDDDVYVTENPRVRSGLTAENIAWAFRAGNVYWHPLTWISHMVDVQIWGLNPGPQHMTNLIFHILNALLLFLALNYMTGTLWRSAFVAALFALHPINVESVAWVAERKNVLSTFFLMVTLLVYGFYAVKPNRVRYLLVGTLFVLGLSAKPMLVTLPFVFLLLDYWPLGRFSFRDASGNHSGRAMSLILEKVPLFCLSGLSIIASSVSVQSIKSLETVPMTMRIGNALVSCVKYICKLFWPFNLAVYYPFPQNISAWQLLGTLSILVIVSGLAIRFLKQYPYVAVGWFWYLGTLVPVSGLVQAGLWPAMADRWAYVPLIGLLIAIVWGIAGLAKGRPYCRKFIPVAAILLLGILCTTTGLQLGYWKNSVALFRHTLEITVDNAVAHNNLGNALLSLDDQDEAYRHYAEALRIRPDYANAHYNMARILTDRGQLDEALRHYEASIRSNPRMAKAYYNRGIILVQKGDDFGAIRNFTQALQLDPGFAEAHNNLGVVLVRQGKIDEAASHFAEAVQLNSSYITARINMQKALNDMKSFDSANSMTAETSKESADYKEYNQINKGDR
jgi:tetratricopeptide (TPR) repeat protein